MLCQLDEPLLLWVLVADQGSARVWEEEEEEKRGRTRATGT